MMMRLFLMIACLRQVDSMDPEDRKKLTEDFNKGGHAGMMKNALNAPAAR
jgi:hypothetical protein